MSEQERRHAENETRLGLGGILADLPVHWLNHPSAEADAGYKPRQLVAAAECGLTVPDTIVTADPAEVRRFASALGPVVIKPLGANVLHQGSLRTLAHTHLLTGRDLADLDGVGTNPHLIQAWVDKDYEVRLTVVGDALFAAAIRACSSAARLDWRRDYAALSYSTCSVPADVQVGCSVTCAGSGWPSPRSTSWCARTAAGCSWRQTPAVSTAGSSSTPACPSPTPSPICWPPRRAERLAE